MFPIKENENVNENIAFIVIYYTARISSEIALFFEWFSKINNDGERLDLKTLHFQLFVIISTPRIWVFRRTHNSVVLIGSSALMMLP